MGYKISSLASLPVVPGMDLYVFVLGNRLWEGSLLKQVEDNFSKIAKELGPKGAIVMGHEGDDISGVLVGAPAKLPPGLWDLIRSAAQGDGGVLILGAHPAKIEENDLILYAPLVQLESQFSGLPAFFNELCRFAKDRNPDFLNKFKSTEQGIDVALDIIELKPNFFGLGFNINNAIQRLRKKFA